MNKSITLLKLAIALMTSFWAFGDAQAFRLITQEMMEKELVVETDLIKTTDNFIILFDTSGTTNQMVPGKTISKIQAAKNLLKERNAWFPNLDFQAGLYVYTDDKTLTGTFKEVYGMGAYDRDRFAAAIDQLPENVQGATTLNAGLHPLRKVLPALAVKRQSSCLPTARQRALAVLNARSRLFRKLPG